MVASILRILLTQGFYVGMSSYSGTYATSVNQWETVYLKIEIRHLASVS